MSQNPVILLSFLPVEWRILYLIYENSTISEQNLSKYFTPNELPSLIHKLQLAILEKTIELNEKNEYKIKIIDNSIFLKAYHYIITTKIPTTRTELRNIIKNKILLRILCVLIQSKIIFEYRTELSKKNYLIPMKYKTETINKINTNMLNGLQQSTKTNDTCHYLMIQNNQSVLSINDNNSFIPKNLRFNKHEKYLFTYLYNDIKKQSRKLGRSEEYLCSTLFHQNKKITKSTITSLVQKQILKCSYHNFYYINHNLITFLKPYYEKYQNVIEKIISL